MKISIATATARGVYKRRKLAIDAAEVKRLSEEERLGATVITRRLGIGRGSGYRHLGRPRQPSPAAA
jgi:DNA invertase Pin-like site-specific DNA recombinase